MSEILEKKVQNGEVHTGTYLRAMSGILLAIYSSAYFPKFNNSETK